jgi:SNF2 family DNA or RNA helicase
MYGATDVEDRKNVVDLFQNDPNTKFFIGNPTVGGYGLTYMLQVMLFIFLIITT